MDKGRFGELVPLYFVLQLTGVCAAALSEARDLLGWSYQLTYWLSIAVWVVGYAFALRTRRPLSLGSVFASVAAVFLAVLIASVVQANGDPNTYWLLGILTVLSCLGAAYAATTAVRRRAAFALALWCGTAFIAGRLDWALSFEASYLAMASAFAFTLGAIAAIWLTASTLLRRGRPSEQALQPDASGAGR